MQTIDFKKCLQRPRTTLRRNDFLVKLENVKRIAADYGDKIVMTNTLKTHLTSSASKGLFSNYGKI